MLLQRWKSEEEEGKTAENKKRITLKVALPLNLRPHCGGEMKVTLVP
jgi:hypothetical protein